VGSPSLFGLDISSIKYPVRYGIFVLAMALLAVVVVANVRRGRSGRRLIAVRTNERAAAALGINVVAAKLFAFAFGSALAALGGILLAFRLTSISYRSFTNFTSITYAGLSLVGGVGHILGAFVGAMMAAGGFNQTVLESTWSGVGKYIQLISGIAILLIVLYNPDGVAAEWSKTIRQMKRNKKFGESYFIRLSDVSEEVEAGPTKRVDPKELVVEDLSVRYGLVTAVDRVNFNIPSGTICGLIGPNGAGKTSLIDALTGFTPTATGRITIGGQDISNAGAVTRVRSGMARSFQSLELFEDTSVFENLSVAADPQNVGAYLRDLVWPVLPKFGPEVVRAIEEFELAEDLHREVSDLSYGKRRLLAIARSVALHPSVLLLDEPAAGLSSIESAELARVVRRLADEWGMAILLVEHDMNFVMEVCDRVVVLDFGVKIADGSPEEIRNDPAVIAAYLGQQTDEELGISASTRTPAVTGGAQ
jgi:ABC-type branched-subunit amino acid transport system ATPase component